MKLNLLRKLRAIRSFWKEVRYTLVGHRDREIRMDIDELRGAIAALHLDRFIQEFANRDSRAELAVVTCLPPDETGIARFSEAHLAAWQSDVDVYTHFVDQNKIVRALQTIRIPNPGASLFSIESLQFNHIRRPYRNIVFVIGNSNHNVVLLKALRSFVESFGSEGVHCYLHDPACFNVTRRALDMTEQEFAKQLAELHGRNVKDILRNGRHVFEHLVDAGLFGPRMISHKFGVRNFIVNSTAAKEIIVSNCGDLAPRIGVLYHPAFELEPGVNREFERSQNSEELVIGSYGCPSLTKMTDVVINACEMLVAEGKKVRLILSGYDTRVYLNRHFGNKAPPWIDIRSQPNEADFQRDMAECDVAIQLRKRNLGESSGVVPTLLRMGKTVITSPTGAFTAYGDSVLYFDGDAAALADLLRKNGRVPAQRVQEFVSKHGIEQFNEAFYALLNERQSPSALASPVWEPEADSRASRLAS